MIELLRGAKPRAEMLKCYFYGTLKRGGRNHELYCGGALHVEDAWVRGELYDLPLFGYPALVIPEESIYAFGTGDFVGDAEKQERLSRGSLTLIEGPRVFGEVFSFDDPASRLPAIDGLEGFDPADESSSYRRVLLPVETVAGSALLAWAYVVEESFGVYLPEGVWPT